MAKRKPKKGPAANVSPATRAKAIARSDEHLAQRAQQGRTPPERIKKLFSGTVQLPKQDKKADAARAAQERADAAKARRALSSTTPGKGKPRPGGKPRGTRGRLTKGS